MGVEDDGEGVAVRRRRGDRAVPIEPDAPPLLSTTTVWPSRCCSGWLRMRATWSTEPPGGNTATRWIGCFWGQACAWAAGAATSSVMNAAAAACRMECGFIGLLVNVDNAAWHTFPTPT